MSSVLTFILGKGGGGKSRLAALLASIAFQAGRAPKLFDFDPANPSLRRAFALPESQVLNRGDGDDYVYQSLSHVADVAAAGNNVLIDVGGGMDRPVLRFLRNEALLDFCEAAGVVPLFIMPVSGPDALSNIRTALQAVPGLPVLCVLNNFFPGTKEAAEHEVFAEIRKQAVGVVELPNLGRILIEATNRNMPFHTMAVDESTTPWLRHGAKTILKRVEELFAPYGDRLP